MKQPTDYKIHLDIDKLDWWLNTSTDDIFQKHSDNAMIETHRFIYRKCPNPTDILIVAHLDTVQPLTGIVKRAGSKVYASGVDDRLGAYIAWDWMKDNGIDVDVLLTDHEEEGASTAEFFGLADSYNWIAEFDREGQDAVTYGLDSKAWLITLFRSGFNVRQGAFSDICFLDTSTCCVNIGNGMRRSHAIDSYFDMKDTQANLQRFCHLYDNFKKTEFVQKDLTIGAPMSRPDDEDLMEYTGGYDVWDEDRSVVGHTVSAPRPSDVQGIWWEDETGDVKWSEKAIDVKGTPLKCTDCNAPASPTMLGYLCDACHNHYLKEMGEDLPF